MTRKIKRSFWLVLLPLGFVLGCGRSEPELKVDPELTNKPFPEVKASQSQPAPPPVGFPSSDRTKGP